MKLHYKETLAIHIVDENKLGFFVLYTRIFCILQLRSREVCSQHRPAVLPDVGEGEPEHLPRLLPPGREVRRVHQSLERRVAKLGLPDRRTADRSPSPIRRTPEFRRQRGEQLRQTLLQPEEEDQQQQQQPASTSSSATTATTAEQQQEEQKPLRDAVRRQQVLLPRPQLPQVPLHQPRQEGDQSENV